MPRLSFAAIRAALPRMLRSAFTENLPYKAAALFLSLVLWIVVERQTPRTVEENFDVLLVLRLDSGLVRVSPLPEVKARLSVPATDLLRLETDTLQIRIAFDNDVPDSMLVRLNIRDLVVPEGVRATRIAIEPSAFVIRFDSLMQRTVPIHSTLRISPAPGVAIAGAPRFEPDSVSIVGRRQVVAGIRSVATETQNLVVSSGAPIRIKLSQPAPGIDVGPQEVSVRIPIVRTQPP